MTGTEMPPFVSSSSVRVGARFRDFLYFLDGDFDDLGDEPTGPIDLVLLRRGRNLASPEDFTDAVLLTLLVRLWGLLKSVELDSDVAVGLGVL